MEIVLRDEEALKLVTTDGDLPEGYQLLEIEDKAKLLETEYAHLIRSLVLKAIKDGTIKYARKVEVDKEEGDKEEEKSKEEVKDDGGSKGGWSGDVLQSRELYDIGSGEWIKAGDVKWIEAGDVKKDGVVRLFMLGGYDNAYKDPNFIEEFSVNNLSWTIVSKKNMKHARFGFRAMAISKSFCEH